MSNQTVRVRRNLGWIPDLPDSRDIPAPMKTRWSFGILPSYVSLRAKMPPVYDQLTLGSCTAQAVCGAYSYISERSGRPDIDVSRLFLYYNSRVIEGTTEFDAGAMIRDVIKSAVTDGICHELQWPYLVRMFKDIPSGEAYGHAIQHKALSYERISASVSQMRGILAQGFPFVFGLTLFDSFMSDMVAKTGVVPFPELGEPLIGGHAMLAVGYDNGDRTFLVRNSWSTGWGDQGYCKIPYDYMGHADLCDDRWVIRDTDGGRS